MLTYTIGSVVAVLCALLLDVLGTRPRLVAQAHFWIAYAIILFFQLIMNGLLTGIPIVTYDPSVHLGLRVVNAPIEDIGFGFALVLSVLTVWSRLGAQSSRQASSEQRRGDA